MTGKLTRERLLDIASGRANSINDIPVPTIAEVQQMASQLLAGMDSKPVAEIRAYYPLGIEGGKQKFVQVTGELPDFGAQLYAAPQPSPAARMVVIPTIWKHYTAAQTAIIYEKAMTDAGIKWRSIDD